MSSNPTCGTVYLDACLYPASKQENISARGSTTACLSSAGLWSHMTLGSLGQEHPHSVLACLPALSLASCNSIQLAALWRFGLSVCLPFSS